MTIKINNEEYSFDGYVYPINSLQKIAEKCYEQGRADAVALYEQIKWERDVALEILRGLGYELGIKPEVIKQEIREDAIDEVVDEIIFPLLNEYDIGLWEDIDYIPLAEQWVESVHKNPYCDEAIKKELKKWITEQLKEQNNE